MRLFTIALALISMTSLTACGTPDRQDPGSESQPSWVETVYPAPGSSATTLAVEVDHTITSTDNDVRLMVDGVDVTTYAAFDAGRLRYESGVGPVVLGGGEHWAEVQLVTLPHEGADYEVLDSYRWEFGIG